MPVTGVPDQGAGQRGGRKDAFSPFGKQCADGEKEAYIATDQAERSIILKGTHIGKDTCLYFYAEKGGYFYEMDPKQAEEKILRLVEKNVVCEQVKKILTGD